MSNSKSAMTLKDTVKWMSSKDYKERFKAEYAQTAIRYGKLRAMLLEWKRWIDTANPEDVPLEKWLGFRPTCSYDLLDRQARAMEQYLNCLEIRAQVEGIDLEGE